MSAASYHLLVLFRTETPTVLMAVCEAWRDNRRLTNHQPRHLTETAREPCYSTSLVTGSNTVVESNQLCLDVCCTHRPARWTLDSRTRTTNWDSRTTTLIWRFMFCNSYLQLNITLHLHSLTHSLTAALDWLRVIAIFTTSGPGLRINRHWWVDPYLLPPVEAKFSVDGPAGASSQWQEVCQWRHQWTDAVLVKLVYPRWIIGRCDQKVSGVDRRWGKVDLLAQLSTLLRHWWSSHIISLPGYDIVITFTHILLNPLL